MAFEEIALQPHNPSNHWRSMSKESWGNITIHRFLQSIWFYTQRKAVAILPAYGLPKETIMMRYKNMKAMICSHDEDIDFFDIVTGVCQGDNISTIFAYTLPRLCTSNLIKENGFTLKKARSKWHADYTDNLALFTNIPVQAESLLHSLE